MPPPVVVKPLSRPSSRRSESFSHTSSGLFDATGSVSSSHPQQVLSLSPRHNNQFFAGGSSSRSQRPLVPRSMSPRKPSQSQATGSTSRRPARAAADSTTDQVMVSRSRFLEASQVDDGGNNSKSCSNWRMLPSNSSHANSTALGTSEGSAFDSHPRWNLETKDSAGENDNVWTTSKSTAFTRNSNSNRMQYTTDAEQLFWDEPSPRRGVTDALSTIDASPQPNYMFTHQRDDDSSMQGTLERPIAVDDLEAREHDILRRQQQPQSIMTEYIEPPTEEEQVVTPSASNHGKGSMGKGILRFFGVSWNKHSNAFDDKMDSYTNTC
jgi:hypothetical protein